MKKILLNSKSFVITFVIANLFLFSTTASFATDYFSAGNNAPNTLANWWTGTGGTGSHPANFTTAGNRFIIQNTHTMTTTATWTVTGAGSSIVINSGGILVATNAVSAPAIDVTGIYRHNQNGGTIPTATWNTGSTCQVTGLGNATTLAGLGQTFYNLTLNSAGQTGDVSIDASLDINGDLTVTTTNNGTFRVSSNATPRTVDVAGNFSEADGEFRLNNSTGSVTMSVGGNFSLSGTALFTLVSGPANSSLSVTGNVSITAGELRMSEDANIGTLNAGGDFTFSGGSITETNTGSGAIVFNKAGTQTFTSGGTVTGTINYTVNSGSTLQMAAATTTVTGAGTFTLSNGATLGITSAVGITAAIATATGNIRTTVGRVFNTGANYTYNSTVAQTDLGTGFPTNLTGTLTINNTNGVTLAAARTIANGGTVSLAGGAFAAGTNLTMATTSTITRGGGTMTGTPQGAGTYNAVYTGASKTTGVELSGTGLNNITLGLTAGQSLTLNASKAIPGTLTINSGYFVIPTSTIFTLSNSTAIGGGPFDATKHIITQVAGLTQGFIDVLNIASASSYTFPVGTGTYYLPVTLTPSGATAGNDFRVSTFTGMTANGLPNGTPTNKANVVDAVWTVNNDNGATTSPVDMTIGWSADAPLEGSVFTGLGNTFIGISHYGGGVWGDYQQTSGNNTTNVVTLNGITSFSPFSVGKLGPSAGSLPIKIYYFNASKGTVANTLNWSAECSSSQATFEIERSADGRNFTTINSITASQARCALPFSFDDASPLAGTNFYRIKMVDIDGRVTYTAIVKVGSQQKDIQLVGVLPNPVTNTAQLSIATIKKDNVELSVIALDGRVMYKQSVQVQSGSSIVNLDVAKLAPGTYFINGVFGDGQTNSIKFIKQ